jgi:hypothetical protein
MGFAGGMASKIGAKVNEQIKAASNPALDAAKAAGAIGADIAKAAVAPPPPKPKPPVPSPVPPKAPALPSAPGGIKIDTSGVRKEFDYARDKAKQAVTSQVQGQRDAMQRRAAQLGGGPSGAFLKMENQAMEEGARRLDDINQGLDAQQMAELRRISEAQAGLDMQKYGIDTSTGVQLYGIDVNKALGEGQLTGTYNGQDTLAKTGQDHAQGIAEAGVTGTYKGQDTLQKQSIDATTDLAKQELKESVKANAINAIISATNSKMDPAAMSQLLSTIGVDFDENGNIVMTTPQIPGITSAKGAPGTTITPGADGKYKPGVFYMEGKQYYRHEDGSYTPVA